WVAAAGAGERDGTGSGWRRGAPPTSRSRRALRISFEEDCSPRHSVLWLAVARAIARRFASALPGAPALTSRSSLPVLSSKDRQPAQAAPASCSGGGAPTSATTMVDP